MKVRSPQIQFRKGVTLLELTVIIITLLTMITVLFIGTAAYKEGTDRATCILNQRNVQTYVRSHQNIWNLPIGAPLEASAIFGENAFLDAKPDCPAGGTYTLADKIPAVGELAFTCDYTSTAAHKPQTQSAW